MDNILSLLSEAHKIIDSEVDCSTPEYRALHALEQVIKELVSKVQEIDNQP